MLTSILLAVCILIGIHLFYKYATYRPEGFPPGPPRLPIFGSYLFMMLSNFKYLHKGVLNFSKWYKSDIVGFHLGSIPIVAIHCAEGIREVLNNSDFNGRPKIYISLIREPNQQSAGIFFEDGPLWKEQRRFILRYLRDYGFGRRFQELEMIIQEEIFEMLNLIRTGPKYKHEEPYTKDGGYRILLPYFFSPFIANVIFYIIFKERKSRGEQFQLWELVRLGMQFQRCSDDFGKLLSIVPWIRYIFPQKSAYKPLMEANVFLYKYFADIINHHIKTYDETSERNFLDLYIREMKKAEKEGNVETSFKHNQFIMGIIDFSFPAFTAIGTQLSFLIQYLLLYPDIQQKIQQEIDCVVGSGRLPILEDRKFCNYTEACIREILRIETLVPSDVPHVAMCDTKLMDYKIPKGTLIIPSLYAYHNDKRVWGDPGNFRPERFLDDHNKLCLNKDVSLPFGAGKRLCAGETFARNMLFLLTTAICQNFNFILGPEDNPPDLNSNLSGLITSPKDFWVQLKERN